MIAPGEQPPVEMIQPEVEKKPPEPRTGLTFIMVGLGNPGREYRNNRHNIGFMAIDFIGLSLGIKLTRLQSRALVGSGTFEGNKVILAKPQTFMNLSGQPVGSLLKFHQVPLEQLIVIHDDIDLPVGAIRIRPTGGAAGQKGLISIIDRLGTEDFPRMRLGIGRPPGSKMAADYVLRDFSKSDQVMIKQVLERGVDAVKVFMRLGITTAMNQFNGKLEGA
jgi:PTH1 family peptidyl-tRNA hydrolase